MNWIQNDNQNIDEFINTPKLKSHYYLFILFHNVTQFRCCFMSDDRVRSHVEVSVVSVSSKSILSYFSFKRGILIAHLNKLIFRKGSSK